jgi:hypothetical protein
MIAEFHFLIIQNGIEEISKADGFAIKPACMHRTRTGEQKNKQ